MVLKVSVAQTSEIARPELSQSLPRISCPGKFLLITTRYQKLGEDLSNGEDSIEVPPFRLQDGRQLLSVRTWSKATAEDLANQDRLLDVLGFIPLAISQAGAYIRQNKMTFEEFLTLLERNDQNMTDYLSAELRDSRRDLRYPNAVFRTLRLCFEQIQRQDSYAANLLSLMAMFDRQAIPRLLLQRPTDKDFDFTTGIGTLKSFSLISENEKNKYTMHRLIQLSTQNWLKQTNKEDEYVDIALSVLANQSPNGNPRTREKSQLIYPHALRALEYPIKSNQGELDQANLLLNVAGYETDHGAIDSAVRRASLASKIRSRILGPNDRKTLQCSSLLGLLLTALPNYNESEDILRRTLKTQTFLFGLDDHDTMRTTCYLSRTLLHLSKLDEAEQLSHEGLRMRQATKGQIDDNTFVAMIVRANILEQKGEYHESETILRETLESQTEQLGKKHPLMLLSMDSLASVLRKQKQYVEAEKIYRQILVIEKILYGGSPPPILKVTGDLAVVLVEQERYEEAQDLLEKVTVPYESRNEEMYLRTLQITVRVAHCLFVMGNSSAARPLYQRVFEGYRKILGDENECTLAFVRYYRLVLDDLNGQRLSVEVSTEELDNILQDHNGKNPNAPIWEQSVHTSVSSESSGNVYATPIRGHQSSYEVGETPSRRSRSQSVVRQSSPSEGQGTNHRHYTPTRKPQSSKRKRQDSQDSRRTTTPESRSD